MSIRLYVWLVFFLLKESSMLPSPLGNMVLLVWWLVQLPAYQKVSGLIPHWVRILFRPSLSKVAPEARNAFLGQQKQVLASLLHNAVVG